jgi:hypothetical protein
VHNVKRGAIICHSDSPKQVTLPTVASRANYGYIKGAYTKCLKQENESSCTTISTCPSS